MERTNEIEGEGRAYDEDPPSMADVTRRMRREAAREWMLLLGSAALVVAATFGIVAVVMR